MAPILEPGSNAERRIYTVSEVNETARMVLEECLEGIWVQGEISNFRAHPSGHHYFSLKDSRCQIAAVMFRGRNRLLRFRPEDGLLVMVRGRVSIYEPRGTYQILVEKMEPRGIGALQLAFEQLKAKLRAEGLFDAARKKPLPTLPQRIGIITSPTGAAVRDILKVLRRRYANLRITIFPTAVQGEGAAAEIAAALEEMNRLAEHDVLILTRGGGSLEDLWSFNEEIVARAIAASRIPVISAVGHEIDFTIADFTADLRAPTPSAAAELVIETKESLQEGLGNLLFRIQTAARLLLSRLRNRVEVLTRSRSFRSVEIRLTAANQSVDDACLRLGYAWRAARQRFQERLDRSRTRLSPGRLMAEMERRKRLLEVSTRRMFHHVSERQGRARTVLETLQGQLESLSPLAVLGRGYAICQDRPSGRILRRAGETAPGREVTVRLHEGNLGCEVKEVKP